MLVIGVDPGTAITGYGIVSQAPDGELEAVEYGVIRTEAGTPLPVRLRALHAELVQLIEHHQPAAGAVEQLFFQRNVKTAMSVGQARGAALLALAQADLPIAEYTPLEVKQAVTGYGGADKRQIQEMVRALLRLSELPRPDDAADALAVAICHLHTGEYDRRLMDSE